MSLLERESPLELLNGWLAQIVTGPAAGAGCVVLVAGEAGIGKTSLLQQFTSGQALAKRVLWGGCEALLTPHPLAPLYDMARQAGGDLPRAISNATTREAVFNATMDHLARGPMPTILVFEDVHWADEATLDLIKYLGRRLSRFGVMLIATYRDDEVGARHPLRAVIGDLPSTTVRRLQLQPLSATAVATLAEAAGRSPARLHEITGGNPFFVTEALAVPETAGTTVPATVRDAVIARLARLSEAARAVVNVVALVPGKTERWLLEKTVPKAGAALQECLSVGMVALPDGALAFRHELARRAVEEHLPIPQRQDLHARILRVLLRQIGTEVPATRLVHHADQAGDSEAVLRYAPLAAERAAAMSAHREAAAHYETAFRHAASWADARRADLLESLSYEYYLIEHVPEAIEAREAALKLWRAAGDPLKIGDSLRWLAPLLVQRLEGCGRALRHPGDRGAGETCAWPRTCLCLQQPGAAPHADQRTGTDLALGPEGNRPRHGLERYRDPQPRLQQCRHGQGDGDGPRRL
ncbi:MAG: AAA family ATPase [Rhodospirillaceae bacterium]|nr:AAA family ATPase [Rhodospirillaceae bacterium]